MGKMYHLGKRVFEVEDGLGTGDRVVSPLLFGHEPLPRAVGLLGRHLLDYLLGSLALEYRRQLRRLRQAVDARDRAEQPLLGRLSRTRRCLAARPCLRAAVRLWRQRAVGAIVNFILSPREMTMK